jgi:hypothetical protein
MKNNKRCIINKFYIFQNKGFFLKYMQTKGFIPDPNIKKSELKKQEGVNLKELLDEKNIKITISDIITDYRYFKREYYSIDFNPKVNKPKLPFEVKDLTVKKFFHYYFIQEKAGNILKTALFLLGINLLFVITYWRMKRLEKLNEELILKLGDSKEDKNERNKHQNKKWSNYE